LICVFRANKTLTATDAMKPTSDKTPRTDRNQHALDETHTGLFDFAPMGYLITDRDGTIESINLNGARLLGLSKAGLSGRRFSDFIHPRERDGFDALFNRCLGKNGKVQKINLQLLPGNAPPLNVRLHMQGHPPGAGGAAIRVRLAFVETGSQIQTAKDLVLSQQCLKIAYEAEKIEKLLSGFMAVIKTYLDCDAVGMRLLDAEGNIPYQAYDGFSRLLGEKKRPLSVRVDQCLCTGVVQGFGEPSKPFISAGGSFFTNAFSRLLASAAPLQLCADCNACRSQGYESVALIPVRGNGRVVGLIHVADRRENQVPLNAVQELERAALRMGMSLQRFEVKHQLDKTIENLDFFSGQLLQAQENEQRRIAMELHDQIGQNLNVLKLQIISLFNRLDARQGDLKELCLKSESYIDKIIDDVRRISYGLSPSLLENFGLAAAVRGLATEFYEYTGIAVLADVDALERITRRNSRIALYRIIQEGLSNVYKHSGASSVKLSAESDGSRVRMEICDNGCGFDLADMEQAGQNRRGMGLGGMRLRARIIGAELVLESGKRQGTRILLEVPLGEENCSS